ncbi:hypothetical protein PMAYCL1PPCAC_30589, partial [Pristionchus mayeri]
VVSSSFVSLTASQCATSDNANCANWVRNGFCNNGAYTTAQKQAYCPNTCLNVGCVATTTVIPTTDINANCARFAANPTFPFCLNSYTAAQKQAVCASTCAFEIPPNGDCAVYSVINNAMTRQAPTNRTNPVTAVAITGAGTVRVSRVSVGPTCTLALFTQASTAVIVGTTTAADT